MDWEKLGITSVLENPLALQFAYLIGVVVVAGISLTIARRILVVGIRVIVARSSVQWDDRLVDAKLFARLAHLAPALVLFYGVQIVPNLNPAIATLVGRVSIAAIVLVIAMSLSAILAATNDIYEGMAAYRSRSIKGYLQLLKIVLSVIATILIVAMLFDKSPLIFLSGLGAMTAVLMLVFRDTILSLVASVQLAGNDMVRVGDWIEMPQYSADGDVIDIALHTVKVQNWDKTITTIPTHKLIDNSFKNWRGMSASGGRRIKRSIFIDMNTIRFLEADDIDHFREYTQLRDYLERKSQDIGNHNVNSENPRRNANIRRLTNVGTFRAYIYHYLRSHPAIRNNMTLLVRQLDPTPHGLPIEIYCFTTTTEWGAYEEIQSDLLDHLLALASDFDLSVYQHPSGRDLTQLAQQDGRGSA
jgi:miniconductance mechanosensitive channel